MSPKHFKSEQPISKHFDATSFGLKDLFSRLTNPKSSSEAVDVSGITRVMTPGVGIAFTLIFVSDFDKH